MERDTLLIVDDSDLDRAILNEIFKNLYLIRPESTARGAMQYLRQHKKQVAAVVVDIHLARSSSGVTLMQNIHAIPGAEDVPVILITADASEEQVLEGIQCGAMDFIAKPVDPLALQERVKNLIAATWHTHRAEEVDTPVELEMDLEEAQAMAGRWQTKLTYMVQYRNPSFLTDLEHRQAMAQKIAESWAKWSHGQVVTPYQAQMIGLAAAFADVGQLALPDVVLQAGGEPTRAGAGDLPPPSSGGFCLF